MAKPTYSLREASARRVFHRHRDGVPAARVAAGCVLGEKYRLISEIGRGGMGSVWRAEHLGWEAPVAIKIMNRNITARPEAVARFEREVRLAAGLRSPHVVQVLDHGVDQGTGTPFIVMELMEGESLAQRLERLGSLSPAETFRIFSQLVRALTRAHAAGIVHRDLKPDNVFLVTNEEESLAKVLDFGVAKWIAPDILESGLTRPGNVVGTPSYMSPEQIRGSREIDHRADLWALAAIACECLTGRRAFQAPDLAQLAVLLLGTRGRVLPSSLGPVPPGFDAWFLRGTEPDISRRFQTAREMAQTLAPVCGAVPSSFGSDDHARRTTPRTRYDGPNMSPAAGSATRLLMNPALWQRPMAKLAGVTVIVTLMVTGVVAFWLGHRSPPMGLPRGATPVAPAVTKASLTPESNAGSRPIQAGERPRAARNERPEETASRRGDSKDTTFSPPPSDLRPRAAKDDVDPEKAQKRVRAALLARPKTRKPRPKPSRRAPANPAPALVSEAPPRSPPARAPAPEATPSPVDGRRIRTTL